MFEFGNNVNLHSLQYNGKNSLFDYQVTISSFEVGDPSPIEIRATVPYRDSDYDFSDIDGTLHYSRRPITVVFNIIAPTYSEADDKRREISNWLTRDRGHELTISALPYKIFRDCICTIADGDFVRVGRRSWTLTVHISCDPYIRIGEELVI